jgi:hypothetical protein
MTERKKILWGLGGAILLGLVAFFVIYGNLLSFTYDAWLLSAGPDQVQHYVGWLMYRQSAWSWPLGLISNYAYPGGVAISYTDSIPLLAIFFKLFSNFLPNVFQYTGLWIMLCFVLQAIFAYLLLNKFFNNTILSILGSGFFILSPIMLFRMGGHFALAGHWLILVALWLIFANDKLAWRTWLILLALALLVHPYLLFMIFFLLLYKIIDLFFIKKVLSLKKLLLFLLSVLLWTFLLAYVFGLFTASQETAPGYGDFSMNLNALINPLGWSSILSDRSLIRYQAEGFNYFGLGLFALLCLAIIKFVIEKNKLYLLKKYYLLILFCLVLIALSLSHVVAWDDHILFTINWPKIFLDNFFGLFRSSGRFFWPVYYLLALIAILSVKSWKFNKAVIILILALALQIYDLTPKIVARHEEYQNKVFEPPENSEVFQVVSPYRHLVFLPVITHKYFAFFAQEAAKNNLTINDGYFARPPKNLENNKKQEIERVKEGLVDYQTIYIFSRDSDVLMKNLDLTKHLVINFDNNIIIFPYYKQ